MIEFSIYNIFFFIFIILIIICSIIKIFLKKYIYNEVNKNTQKIVNEQNNIINSIKDDYEKKFIILRDKEIILNNLSSELDKQKIELRDKEIWLNNLSDDIDNEKDEIRVLNLQNDSINNDLNERMSNLEKGENELNNRLSQLKKYESELDELKLNLEDKNIKLDKKILRFDELNKELNIKNKIAESKSHEAENIINETEKLKEIQEKLFEEKTIGFPWVAELYSEYVDKIYSWASIALLLKQNPAPKASEIVDALRARTKAAEKSAYIYQGLLKYYEQLFPKLSDYQDISDIEVLGAMGNERDDHTENDIAKEYISNSDWNNLSSTDKFQIALDNYWNKKKSNWQIGRDYERYIGYEYEQNGYDVTFFGAIKGFEDMGRDLIARKNNETYIIQCKNWSSNKTIHEKHIFQLYGTCVLYVLENKNIFLNNQAMLLDIMNTEMLKGIFITSCRLSDTAKECADYLGIKVVENKKLIKYPSIKCNISSSGEKIYHLPFDQQYDKIKIDKNNGEFYCDTILKAEANGFRRAYRWHGNS